MLNRRRARPGRAVDRDHLQRFGERPRRNPWEARHDARGLRWYDLEDVPSIPLAKHVRESRADLARPIVDDGVVARRTFVRRLTTYGEDDHRHRVRVSARSQDK